MKRTTSNCYNICGFAVYTGSDKKSRLNIACEFEKLKYRGPDHTQVEDLYDKGWMGFHHLKNNGYYR
ncbi:MAG: hypothetical protein ACLFM7_12955 [Bacteroidales bacterium]